MGFNWARNKLTIMVGLVQSCREGMRGFHDQLEIGTFALFISGWSWLWIDFFGM
jgi:hypothetical protein